MEIRTEKCNKCLLCIPYCPANAIYISSKNVSIDYEKCVECSACIKSGVCTQEAFYQPELTWPRLLRAQFSDPLLYHPFTKIRGRGTAEVKTNDVTGRISPGTVGLAIEVGRPGVTASFADIESITVKISGMVSFAQFNPLSKLIHFADGKLKDDRLRKERVLSAIIECAVPETRLDLVLHTLRDAAKYIDTVFSMSIIRRFASDEKDFRNKLTEAGFPPAENGKVNIGLGRPLV